MKWSVLVAVVSVALVVGVVGQAWGQQYSYTPLDDPLGTNVTEALGIEGNNIVGVYQDATHYDHGFLYNRNTNTYMTLDAPGEPYNYADAISGDNIAMTASDGYLRDSAAFVYQISTNSYTKLPYGPYHWTLGISGSNIVGTDATSGSDGFLYNMSTSSSTTLDDPLGTWGSEGNVGIDGKDIVHYYTDAKGASHGFLYNGTSYTTLDDPLGTEGTYPAAISGNNIVGYYQDATGADHGFLYNGTSYTTLDDPLATKGTYPTGISGNNIVGYYTDATGAVHGFIATPTPEPSTLVLLSVGAIGLVMAWRRWRKRQAA